MRIEPLVLLATAQLALAQPGGELPTASFRAEHAEVLEELDEVAADAGRLTSLPKAEQRAQMRRIVAFFEDEIAPHAAWEEEVLYPLVDRLAGGGEHAFTATMRHEHDVVAERIGELRREASRAEPDPREFMRKTDRLLGLLTAHFSSEEQVLLPLIDRSMTRAEYERAVSAARPPRASK